MSKKGKNKNAAMYQGTGAKVGRVSALVMVVIWILFAALMYYLFLPAMNVHSVGMWLYVILVLMAPATCLIMLWYGIYKPYTYQGNGIAKPAGIALLGTFAVLVLLGICSLTGAKIFHAQSYASIMQPQECVFTEDLDQASAVSQIALMDTDSAILLGNREIGSLSELVSQYDVSENYSQIDYNGTPLKVSALDYAGFFKYCGNKDNGVPGYVKVDPVGQNATYVSLDTGMQYVPSAYFSKDLARHMRFQYPAKIFGNLHFEIDEDGKPFYVASVYDYTIGVFGGETVQGAIVCDAVTGESTYYDLAEVPRWVDMVFDGDLLAEQYNWYGKLSNGFMNSIFGKKGCKKCSETVFYDEDGEESYYGSNYGYVAKDGDIWIYTGVTSVNDDASNIGFILSNERTGETHYYNISGADESSAMSAAEGEVQEKGYQASFPSLINVDEQPTYIMVLKDASGIVKLYAMVNVESYNVVTTATTLDDCFKKYRALLGTDTAEESDEVAGQEVPEEPEETVTVETESMTFVISRIQYADVDGNTYVYYADEAGTIYCQKFADDPTCMMRQEGDTITVECALENGVYRIYP
ncbi:MAG: hypothetical protein MR355_09825 [Lachnospiraceae bacterium]|nr:hypothetical protein [Lachnospiraceae bacterium]